jgi:hypothetical protein
MKRSRRTFYALTALTVAVTALRIAWIVRVPDVDMDAYGHFTIARGLCEDPWNLGAHWVWLPLYHFLLTALACAHGKFVAARILSALFIAALPLMVYGYDGRGAPDRARTALLAALACALTAIPNVIGVSAQQESLFALCILASAWAIDARSFYAAGALLAAACLIRYEAWGAAGLVIAQPLLVRLARRVRRAPQWLASLEPLPIAVALPPATVIAGWILVHRFVDGTWLAFLGELYRYTHTQREVLSHGPLMEALWFPLLVPLITFGPLVVFALFGMQGALQRGWILPIGIYGFLLFSYLGGGVLGGERYYGSLAPFICIAMAHGASRLAHRPRLHQWARYALIATIGISTSIAFFRLGRTARAQATTLTAAEARMNAPR